MPCYIFHEQPWQRGCDACCRATGQGRTGQSEHCVGDSAVAARSSTWLAVVHCTVSYYAAL